MERIHLEAIREASKRYKRIRRMWVGWGKCIVLTDDDSVYSVRPDDRWRVGHGVLGAREYMQA
jgi:hypothetical protein